jgi:TorA maturation chaperone TorD
MAFFSQHLQPWVPQMCQTLRAHPAAVFYAHLAAFTEAFLSVEMQGFDLVA